MRNIERLNFNGQSSPDLKRLQDSVLRALSPLTRVPTLNGVLIGPVEISSTAFTTVPHKLGRKFQGWQITRIDTNATVWEDFTAPRQGTSVSLRASSTCNVYLWVF